MILANVPWTMDFPSLDGVLAEDNVSVKVYLMVNAFVEKVINGVLDEAIGIWGKVWLIVNAFLL